MSDIEKVKQLRKSTGAGFKDCNLALKESKGNLDKLFHNQSRFFNYDDFEEQRNG